MLENGLTKPPGGAEPGKSPSPAPAPAPTSQVAQGWKAKLQLNPWLTRKLIMLAVLVAVAGVLWHRWRWMWTMERGEGTRKLDRQRALIGFAILAAIALGRLAVSVSIWNSR